MIARLGSEHSQLTTAALRWPLSVAAQSLLLTLLTACGGGGGGGSPTPPLVFATTGLLQKVYGATPFTDAASGGSQWRSCPGRP